MKSIIVLTISQMKIDSIQIEEGIKKTWSKPGIVVLHTQFTNDIEGDCAALGKVIGNEDALTTGGANVCGAIPTS